MRDGMWAAPPIGWKWQELGSCAQLINGRAYSQHELLDRGTPVLRIQNLNGGDRWYYSNLVLPAEKYCHDGDLLYAWSASFGPYRWTGPKAIFHYHIWKVVPHHDLDKAFAYRLLQWITAEIKSAAHGVAMLHMTKAEMEAWPVPIPPLAEQRRIASILDATEALREKRRQAIAELDSLVQSVFLEMFGDSMCNSHRWPVQRLGDLAEKFSDGPFGSNLKTEHYTNGGVRVIRLQNIGVGEFLNSDKVFISNTHFRSLAKHTCMPGDVLIGTLGDPNLRACIQPTNIPIALNKADCVQMRVEPRKADPAYISALLNQPSTQLMAQGKIHGQTRLRISMGRLRELIVPVPPLALQRAFQERVAVARGVKGTQLQSLLNIDSLFASLQQRAFRGDL